MKTPIPLTTHQILPNPPGSKKNDQPFNPLNLPTSINFYSENKRIDYIYTASGQKTEQKTIDDGRIENRRQYAGSFVFKNRKLSYVASIAGRFLYLDDGRGNTDFKNEYSLKDHLGNTRVTLDHGGNTVQQIDYYPFGHMIYESDTETPFAEDNRFLYNGKELQDDFDLNWYDYGARFYDAQIGRFHTVDPHAENYFHASPFSYVENNPISRIDPDGRDWYEDKDGNLNWHADLTKDNADQFFQDNKIEGSYLGNYGWSINSEGLSVLHGDDGSETSGLWQLNEVVVEAEKTDHQRTMNNPLVQANHEGQSEFIRGAAEVSALTLNTTGTGLQLLGTGFMAVPGLQPIGGALIGGGNVVSTVSTGISMGLNANDGEWGQFLFQPCSPPIPSNSTKRYHFNDKSSTSLLQKTCLVSISGSD